MGIGISFSLSLAFDSNIFLILTTSGFRFVLSVHNYTLYDDLTLTKQQVEATGCAGGGELNELENYYNIICERQTRQCVVLCIFICSR